MIVSLHRPSKQVLPNRFFPTQLRQWQRIPPLTKKEKCAYLLLRARKRIQPMSPQVAIQSGSNSSSTMSRQIRMLYNIANQSLRTLISSNSIMRWVIKSTITSSTNNSAKGLFKRQCLKELAAHSLSWVQQSKFLRDSNTKSC